MQSGRSDSAEWINLRAQARSYAYCGATCGLHADWYEVGNVHPGEEFSTAVGWSVEDGFQTTQSFTSELAVTIGASGGFSWGPVDMSVNVETTASIASTVEETLTRTHTQNWEETWTRTFPSSGILYQARMIIHDTCGRQMHIGTDEMALTYDRTVRPRCFPGGCMADGPHQFCCHCKTGEDIPNAPLCPPPMCPSHATTGFVRGASHAELSCGHVMQGGDTCDVDCGLAVSGLVGTIVLECSMEDGSIDQKSQNCVDR